MKNGGGRLANPVHLAKRKILVDQRVERAALDQCADLVHFRGSEDRGHRPIHVSRLLPFFLVLEQSLLHRLDLADLRRGASIASGQDRKSTRLNSSHSSISY